MSVEFSFWCLFLGILFYSFILYIALRIAMQELQDDLEDRLDELEEKINERK